MIRRLNYTGRVKIDRSDVRLSTHERNGGWVFEAGLQLNDYELPADAPVFVEAYRQTTWMRFGFGTVGNLRAPPADQRQLVEFDSPDGVLFRVKVTQAHDEHLLLAHADRIPLARPEDAVDRESLLPVVPADLGDELWRVSLEDEPQLLVNKSASPDWRQMAQSPLFVSLVYPAVLRQVLTAVLIDHRCRDIDDESDWCSRWLRFAVGLPGVNPELPPEKDAEDAVRIWTDDAVAGFARKLQLREKFSGAWQQGAAS